MVSRLASTSRSKSSSTAGALSISSRQRAAETTRGPWAGRNWATATPLRTTSTSSPAPTLLITCENLLATSVAVRLIMYLRYQINLIPEGEQTTSSGNRKERVHEVNSAERSHFEIGQAVLGRSSDIGFETAHYSERVIPLTRHISRTR